MRSAVLTLTERPLTAAETAAGATFADSATSVSVSPRTRTARSRAGPKLKVMREVAAYDRTVGVDWSAVITALARFAREHSRRRTDETVNPEKAGYEVGHGPEAKAACGRLWRRLPIRTSRVLLNVTSVRRACPSSKYCLISVCLYVTWSEGMAPSVSTRVRKARNRVRHNRMPRGAQRLQKRRKVADK